MYECIQTYTLTSVHTSCKHTYKYAFQGMKNHMDLNDATFSGRPGKIYLFDFNRPNDPVKELQIEGAVDIVNCAPHGIGVWEDKSGNLDLFLASNCTFLSIIYRSSFREMHI